MDTKKIMAFKYQDKQDHAEQCVRNYLLIKNSSHTVSQLRQAEKELVDSLQYLIKMQCSQYRGYAKFSDQIEDTQIIIAEALKTYNPRESSSFTYWLTMYLKTYLLRAKQKTIRQKKHIKLLYENEKLEMELLELNMVDFLHLKKCILDLPKKESKIIELFMKHGSYKEVQAELGDKFSHAHASAKYRRILKILKEKL